MLQNRKFITRWSVALIALIMVGFVASWKYQSAQAAGTWTLQWSDEFNGAAGTGVDTANWIYDLGHNYPGGAANWGTGEVENNTNSTNNVYQDGNGNLAIKPIKSGTPGTWTSGRIETQRLDFQPAAGGVMAVEARIQLPNVTGTKAQGYWPAFWMLGAPFRGNYTNWPMAGEIDIMENVNGTNTLYGTFHCGVNPGGPCNETNGIGNNTPGGSPTLQAAFHTYRVEFDKSVSPQQIRWYLDGVQYHSVSANQVDATTWDNATNHGFFIILNVAIGGGWPGSPTRNTLSGVPMLVDYVRVYAR
jgi:beta-glucanase (GH16 family)